MDATIEPPEHFPGTARFHPVALLGRGGMGVVYRVHDAEMGVDVALKTLTVRDPAEAYLLKDEFRSLTGVVHRNLVELYELFVDEQTSFFTMELVEGGTFVDYVRNEGGGADWGRLAAALAQLVDGVSAIHAEGKLHRDLKPSNVLVTPSGRVVVLDFGLVVLLRGVRAGAAKHGVTGTLAYMAPEQAWGKEPTPAADWYAVGVMLYESLTGRLPFAGSAATIVAAKSSGAPPSVHTLAPDVPAELDALVTSLLDPEPTHRAGQGEILATLRRHFGVAAGSAGKPSLAGAVHEVPFVGRTAELAELARAFAATEHGRASIVLVEGQSGIGKSELVRRFLGEVERDQRAVVLEGRCHPHEAVPYKALDGVIDSLSRFLATLPQADVQPLVPQHAPALTRLFPVLARIAVFASGPGGDDAAEPFEIRRRGFLALRELLSRIGATQPLVLWIDDLQWGDADSAALLRELLSPPDPPVMLSLLSYRSEDREGGPLAETLKTSMGDLPAGTACRVVLAPLSAAETRDLAARLCSGPAREQIGAIAGAANGSPFLVTQLVHHAAMRPMAGDAAIRAAALPLQTLLAELIEQLGASAQELLELVSIAARPLDRTVALAAAGIGERGRPFISKLEHAGLLRMAPRDVQPTIEVYHDRIREVVVAQLPEQRLRTRHRQLADTIERQPSPDPDLLYRHYLGADERERAGEWAVRAADRASDALAFAEAAQLYGEGLTLKAWNRERRAELRTRQADALANAGRGAEAAPLFLEAAEEVGVRQRLDLSRRAAEQFLATGHLDRGAAVMRNLLDVVGLRFPRTAAGAIAGSLGKLLAIRLRGLEPRAVAAASEMQELRADASHAVAKGYVMVDPLRGLYFAVSSLLLALRCGDRLRVARELAGVGAALLPAGPPFANWASAMLERARAIAQQTGDPYLLGFTAVTLAQKAMVDGKWRRMLELCDGAVDILRSRCRGAAWELTIGSDAACRALEELGEYGEMRRRAEDKQRLAEERGDLYAAYTSQSIVAVGCLVNGELDRAREHGRAILQFWPSDSFQMQHFYVLRVDAYADVGSGKALEGWRRLEREWKTLERSNLLRHLVLRVDAHLLRARVALAAAQASPPDRQALLSSVEGDARRLDAVKRDDTAGYAAMLRAGAACVRGDRAAAGALLGQAAERFTAADMSVCRALARSRIAHLGGEPLDAESNEVFEKNGIHPPDVLLAMFAPGFPSPAPLAAAGSPIPAG
jgi:hypothetical protein